MRLDFRAPAAAIMLFGAATQATAQRPSSSRDTVGVVMAVLKQLRFTFPPRSVFIDPSDASGQRLMPDSIAASIGARIGAVDDIVQCTEQNPSTCHVNASLVLRLDSMSMGGERAVVVVHTWRPASSKLMPVEHVRQRYFVQRRAGVWVAKADRRIQVSAGRWRGLDPFLARALGATSRDIRRRPHRSSHRPAK